MSNDSIVLVTEPVVPLPRMLKDARMEAVVMGWRGVGAGLSFLHNKAGISHNNLCISSVYVNTVDSQWKIGGMEAASRHAHMDAEVLLGVETAPLPGVLCAEYWGGGEYGRRSLIDRLSRV